MKLYIAEKPSLARAIAAAMPAGQKKAEGYIQLSNGDCITWCIGHLLEQAEPDVYDPAYKKWSEDTLPIIPHEWQLKAKAKTKKQLSIVKNLCKQADVLVHVGDPDREGQLLVDEVMAYIKLPKSKMANMQRCLLSDLTPLAVKRALDSLRSNREFIPLSVSALARSRADWLYGINMTRAYTLQGQKVGYKGVLSVGRVQTPVLGLVVRRDKDIEGFTAKAFYEVDALLETENKECFTARWQPSEACSPYQDEEGRVLVKALAENVVARISDKPAKVLSCQAKDKKRYAPLPFNLSALQIEAAKAFSMSAKQVLDICQSLYEKHQLITYPRSDSRHLPTLHYAQRSDLISAIKNNCEDLAVHCDVCQLDMKPKAFNDAKVDAHHAIVPTAKKVPTVKKAALYKLSKQEALLYTMIARQYLAQFHPPYRYKDTKAEIEIAGGLFKAHSDQVIDLGYKLLFQKEGASTLNKSSEPHTLPALKAGQLLHCIKGELLEKLTQPPKSFTDATLLAAMTGISRFVVDKDIKAILKETDGLGTEATRAGIIELLFKRGFLQRINKQIKATPAGRALIETLPEQASLPDMTAKWEAQLSDICEKKLSYQNFMLPLESNLQLMITQAFAHLPKALEGLQAPTKNRSFKRKKRRVSKSKA